MKYVILLFIFFHINNTIAQGLIEEFIYSHKSLNLTKSNKLFNSKTRNNFEKSIHDLFKVQFQLLQYGTADELNIKINPLDNIPNNQKNIIKSLILMNEADILKHRLVGQDSIIFSKYQKALVLSENYKPISCEILKRILTIAGQNSHLIDKFPHFLKLYKVQIFD